VSPIPSTVFSLLTTTVGAAVKIAAALRQTFTLMAKELRSLCRGFRETINAIRQGTQESVGDAEDDGSDG
jgi:hypothetical protein